jgi:hypothetical protein
VAGGIARGADIGASVTPCDPVGISSEIPLPTALMRERAAAKLNPFRWAEGDDSEVSTSSRIRAPHFGEARTAIQELWLRKRLGPLPQWTVGATPNDERQFSARDINDLRSWVDNYAASTNGIDGQGMYSLGYYPNDAQHRGVLPGPLWIDDLDALRPTSPRLRIRMLVNQRDDGGSPLVDNGRNGEASDRWYDRNYFPGFILTRELKPTSGANASPAPGGFGKTNSYITDFAQRAADLAAVTYAERARTFWIWNEPNLVEVTSGNEPPENKPTAMSPANFAWFGYAAAQRVRTVAPAADIILGNLNLVPGTTGTTPGSSPLFVDWLDATYKEVKHLQPYPWSAIGITLHGQLTESQADEFRDRCQDKAREYDDDAPVVVSEWGFSVLEGSSASATAFRSLLEKLRARFSLMYYISHHLSRDGFGAVTEGYDASGAPDPMNFTVAGRNDLWTKMQFAYAGP